MVNSIKDIYMGKIDDDIKNNIGKCYLIYGEDPFRRKLYEGRFKNKIVDESAQMMNVSVFNDAKTTAGQVIEAAETLPFLNDRRFILVKDCGFLSEGKKAESELLAEYISDVPETACILFSEEKADKRLKLYKAIVKAGICEEIKPFDEKALIDLISRKLEKNGIKIARSLCAYMVRNSGENIELLSADTDKLIAYLDGKNKVTAEDIDAVCSKISEVKVFDMVSAMISGDSERALEIYRNLLNLNESPFMVLSLISRQFRIILKSKSMSEAGIPNADIAKLIGVPAFAVSGALRQAGSFSYGMLIKALNSCLKTDYGIKLGKAEPAAGVEALIVTRASTL